MKPVFQITTTLDPCLDKNHYDVAVDTIKSMREANPEYAELWWSLSIKEFPNGTTVINISVLDPKKSSSQENAKLIFWLVGIAIIVGLLAYV